MVKFCESDLKEWAQRDSNKKKAKKGLKFAGIVFGVILGIDFLSMLLYF